MQLLCVDESGDPGIPAGSPSDYFFLAGLLLEAKNWYALTNSLIGFRHDLAR